MLWNEYRSSLVDACYNDRILEQEVGRNEVVFMSMNAIEERMQMVPRFSSGGFTGAKREEPRERTRSTKAKHHRGSLGSKGFAIFAGT